MSACVHCGCTTGKVGGVPPDRLVGVLHGQGSPRCSPEAAPVVGSFRNANWPAA